MWECGFIVFYIINLHSGLLCLVNNVFIKQHLLTALLTSLRLNESIIELALMALWIVM